MDAKIIERRGKGLYWDRAWKLIEGCTKVSPGCDNCWSESETVMRSSHPNEKISERASDVVDFVGAIPCGFGGNISMREDNLDLPLRVKKPTVFAIWNDLFHENVTSSFLDRAYAVMTKAEQHTFLILTKRPDAMANYIFRAMCDEDCHYDGYYSALDDLGIPDATPPLFTNVYHGTTVCNQDEADRKIPLLSQVPGKTFLSIEPMLGPINLNRIYFNGVVDQVLLGGESGKNARPMHPLWIQTIRDQCESAGVPFMFKQWGEWCPRGPDSHGYASVENVPRIRLSDTSENDQDLASGGDNAVWMNRAGKKKSGRILDGQIHEELTWDK